MKKLLLTLLTCISLMSCNKSTNSLKKGDMVHIKGTDRDAIVEYKYSHYIGTIEMVDVVYADDLGKIHNLTVDVEIVEKISK